MYISKKKKKIMISIFITNFIHVKTNHNDIIYIILCPSKIYPALSIIITYCFENGSMQTAPVHVADVRGLVGNWT